MPFSRPSLTDLIERATADIEARLPAADARLRRSNLNVLARVHSGAMHGAYGFLAWAALQVLPDTADTEVLDRWANLFRVPRKAPTSASAEATFTGALGLTIPANSLLMRADGVEYVTLADGTFISPTLVVEVAALSAGVSGNADAGAQLLLAAPVAGINSRVTLVDGATGGGDGELDDSLRARLLARLRQPPQGGAAHDYVAWALSVPGVTRAWVFPQISGANTVGVAIVTDTDAGVTAPTAEVISATQALIDEQRPVTADPMVFVPTFLPVNVTLEVTPDNAYVRAAVLAELTDLFSRESVPGGRIPLTHFAEAISLAEGETDHVLASPSADVVPAATQMPVLGTVTFT
jgi:uncharacterized phage protein gp47/JayE